MFLAKKGKNINFFVFVFQSLGSHAPIVPTKILSDPDELDRHLVQNGYPEAFRVPLDDDDSPDTEGLIGGVTLYPDTEIDFHVK